jgi:hypothetical protein
VRVPPQAAASRGDDPAARADGAAAHARGAARPGAPDAAGAADAQPFARERGAHAPAAGADEAGGPVLAAADARDPRDCADAVGDPPARTRRGEEGERREVVKKIPSVWQRNYDGDRLVRPEVVPGCEWVLAGEGIAYRKWDGTACMVRGGMLFKRYDAKRGKIPPVGFEPCQPEADPVTGHHPGWMPVGDGPEDKYFREAIGTHIEQGVWPLADGTYECVGPAINGNPDCMPWHNLVPHTLSVEHDIPRAFDGMRTYLATREIEGVVFRHPDGRMAKAKRTDFGLPWGRKR